MRFDGRIRVDSPAGRSTLTSTSLTAGMIEACYESTVKTASMLYTLCILSYLLRFYHWHQNLGTPLVQFWWLFRVHFCDWNLQNNLQQTTWKRGGGIRLIKKKQKVRPHNAALFLKITEGWCVDKRLIMNGNLIPDMYVMTGSICETALIHILCHHRVYGKMSPH